MITARSHAAPALPAPNPPMAVSHGRQLSIGGQYGHQRECGGQGATANPCRRAQRRVSQVRLASLPSLHKSAGIIGQAAMVQHEASHGFIGTLGLRLGQRLTNIINGAQRNAKAFGMILQGLGVHLQGLHFARHDGDVFAGDATDVTVLANQRAIAAQGQFSSGLAGVIRTTLGTIAERDDRGMGLGGSVASGNSSFETGANVVFGDGVHRKAPLFCPQYIGPSVLMQGVFL